MADKRLVTGEATEPLLSRAAVTGFAAAAVAAAVAFGAPLTDAQQIAVVGLVVAGSPFVMWLWGRRHVNSPASTKKVLDRR